MKQINRHAFAAPLYAWIALLLCFGSCRSSENTQVSEGAPVASLPLAAQMGETSSRVGMTDIYGGTFSCYWNGDKLNVYQKYVLSGIVQDIMPLEFSTSATSGTSATFSYTGSTAHRYNPGSRLYAFSKGISGEYTASVGTDGTSTLTANTLASQNGTLADCATYDALYGSASVNYNTGLPELLSMHHLFGMMNLHLTSSTFSTSYPVTVTLTTSAGTKLLPDNNGNATFKADGTPDVTTGTWGTSWTATITPTTTGVVDVYFMTWPFTSSTGTLTVSCSDASGYNYTPRKVTLSGFSLAAAQLKSKPLAITNTPADPIYSNHYAWDATDSKPVTLGTVPTNAGTNTATDYLNHANYACKTCPNANEISWYLSVDCYWDNGSINGGNTTSYKLADGNTTKAGIWFKKKSGITGFSSTTSSGTTFRNPISLNASLAASLDLSTNYFFLPASGYTDYNTGLFLSGGTVADYWSSTPDSSVANSYNLGFDSNGVGLVSRFRTYGMCLWQAQ